MNTQSELQPRNWDSLVGIAISDRPDRCGLTQSSSKRFLSSPQFPDHIWGPLSLPESGGTLVNSEVGNIPWCIMRMVGYYISSTKLLNPSNLKKTACKRYFSEECQCGSTVLPDKCGLIFINWWSVKGKVPINAFL
jgi:hypothetical protein